MSNDRENMETEATRKEEELAEITVSSVQAVDCKEETPISEGSHSDSIEEGSYVYAGFWMRFWAYLADIIIVSSVNRILIYP
ncbi:MAG: RDD family protein, partial [Niallia sp.]